MANFLQLFALHANELLQNEKYINWKPIEPGRPGCGIQARGPDPQQIIHLWRIMPTEGYPETPPVVIATPAYTNDPCWRDGCLHYNMIPWQEMIARRVANPLHYLITELMHKYHLGV